MTVMVQRGPLEVEPQCPQHLKNYKLEWGGVWEKSGHKEGIRHTIVAYLVTQAPQPAKDRDQSRGSFSGLKYTSQTMQDKQTDIRTNTTTQHHHTLLQGCADTACTNKMCALDPTTGHPSPRLTWHWLH